MSRVPPAFAILLLALALGSGCARRGTVRPATTPFASTMQPAREGVPDSVMLHDQVGSFYRDSPAP